MAASYTFGVTAAQVTRELPVNSANVGPNTDHVSTTDIDQWINAAAAKLNAIAKKSGVVTSSDMDVDAHDAIADAVRAYAVWMSLGVMGITGQVATDARDRWQAVYAEYSNRPQQLGDAYADTYTVQTDDADVIGDAWDFGGTSGQW